VLVVEDERRLASAVRRGLTAEGFVVDVAHDGVDGLHLAREGGYDAVVLDLMLPGLSGYQVCERLRAERNWVPVLILSAKDGEYDQADGLDLGADDYMPKPFSVEELAARIRARIRGVQEEGATLRAGPLSVDLAAHRASLYGRDVLLSARELTLLASLLRHQGEILSRRKLLQLVWKVDFDPGSNVVEVYVAALRRKIGADFIETVRGLGYRFVVPDDTLAEDQTAAR